MAHNILSWIDENLENALIFPMYFSMMFLVALGVVLRFFLHFSFHWAIQISIGLFVWFTWLGCSWNVKARAHLRLSSLREKLPQGWKLALLMLDYFLWIAFAVIASYFSIIQIGRLMAAGSVIYGAGSVPQWVIPLCIPISFTVLVFRVVQCAVQDIKAYKRHEDLNTLPAEMA